MKFDRDKIKKVSRINLSFKENQVNKLFSEDYYGSFNIFEQAETLSYFLDPSNVQNLRAINATKWDYICNSCINGIKQIENEENIENKIKMMNFSREYLILLNTHRMSSGFVKPDINTCNTLTSELNQIINEYENFISNDITKEIIEEYLKVLVIASSNDEAYKKLLNSSANKNMENIIIKYINSIDMKKNLYADNTLSMIIDAYNVMNSNNIQSALKRKTENYDVILDNYKENLTTEKEKSDFFNKLVMYRMKNGMVPEEIACYISQINFPNALHIGCVDFLKEYMQKIGIENPFVAKYNLKNIIPGAEFAAGTRGIGLKRDSFDYRLFHEVQHLKQKKYLRLDKDIDSNKYLVIKDWILMNCLPEGLNSRRAYFSNHDKYFHEIDADIQGAIQYSNWLYKIGKFSDEQYKSEMQNIKDQQQRRIKNSRIIKIDGKNYNKYDLFDRIVKEDPNLIHEFPILQIEYNENGNKKDNVEINIAINKMINSNKITKSQGNSIEDVICNFMNTRNDKIEEEER